MSPYEIKILLAIYTSPEWRLNINNDTSSDLWYQTMEKFRHLQLLGEDDQCTERLIVYCDALCNIPMPIQQWVMP